MDPIACMSNEERLAGVDYSIGAGFPPSSGLYDSSLERDSCGVGFIADLSGLPSRVIVTDVLEILKRLTHRGAVGSDEKSGDGAGILCSIPDVFFRRVAFEQHLVSLPDPGDYSVGNVFLPKNEENRLKCIDLMQSVIQDQGLDFLFWRSVPVDNSDIGEIPKSLEPFICQIFVGKPDEMSKSEFEGKLFVSRKLIMGRSDLVYICSLSRSTIVYKGQLTPEQLSTYFLDLLDPEFTARLAMVHSRFSTNTFPSWERAQPFRMISHNGEINTLKGNVNWTRSREALMESPRFPQDTLKKLFPIIEKGMSDSGALDNVLEFLIQNGKRLPEAVMMMIPEAWKNDQNMPSYQREFYEFHSSLMEPWDGPALVAFTDGNQIGAVLDRNGLRPGRYYVTKDGRVICSSEVGVIDIEPEWVLSKGRLRPGHMFLIDIEQGRIISDDEIKFAISHRYPFGVWLNEQKILLENDKIGVLDTAVDDNIIQKLRAFGYTTETLEMLLEPMASSGYEALGSMGNDIPLACLSSRPKNVYDYFRQLFAQVTNPPIDPIREKIVTSLTCPIGPEYNLLRIDPKCAHRLYLSNPVLTSREFSGLKKLEEKLGSDWRPVVISICFPKSEGRLGLKKHIIRICDEAESLVNSGAKFLILSDVLADSDYVPIMSAMAVGAVHHRLIQKCLRSKVGLILESGDAREVHHFSVLLGFGADAIFPWMAYQALFFLKNEGKFSTSVSFSDIVSNYQDAVAKGITKVMSKMGVSTLQSYKGAQIFEALGIHSEVINLCFLGCISRIGGARFETFATDLLISHDYAYASSSRDASYLALLSEGIYHWRQGKNAELHLNDPTAIAYLQQACRSNDLTAFRNFADITNKIVKSSTLRGLMNLDYTINDPIPISQVEPAKEIVKRFVTGAMSFGSISRETHVTMARAMNSIGAKSNTGEGGEESDRYDHEFTKDSAMSAIKQVASGRFGVDIYYLKNSVEIQIKMAQGAKPGEGGELPGYKVQGAIAKTRKSTPGVGLISPPPHHDIYSIEDLAQLIFDLKNANPEARISVKLVSEVGVGVVAAGVAKGKASHILISGHDGGTGASRWTGIKYAGLPWELGLVEAHQTLVQNGLRDRVVLQTDGQLKTGLDVVKAALLGAEEFGFGTTALISLGCIMMRKCHLNTCPVGIASQDPELRKKFEGQPEHLVNFMFMIAEDTRQILADLGFRSIDDIIGRSELLKVDMDQIKGNPKLSGLDFSLLLKPAVCKHPMSLKKAQEYGLSDVLDRKLINDCHPALNDKEVVNLQYKIRNINRTTGGLLSNEICKRFGEHGLPDGTVNIKFIGSAGQSFGAWLAPGIQFELEGDANDYVGKGLSGGRIIIYPSMRSPFITDQDIIHSIRRPINAVENIIAGNVLLYGATKGELFVYGAVAERFAVRNSGAVAVVEGCGDHGCEYMTGGIVIILGTTGRNFAAGMSGGLAYVLDENGEFSSLCNQEMVDLDPLDDEDASIVQCWIQKHKNYTGSVKAKTILESWDSYKFVKVFPKDFKSTLAKQKHGEVDVKPPEVVPVKDGVSNFKDIEDMNLASSVTQTVSRPVEVQSPIKNRGFVSYARGAAKYRDEVTRVKDFAEIYTAHNISQLKTQAARCMDCGIPFCHQEITGCPLGNRIPEWNELVYKNRWKEALDRLLATNNFPEFTGRVCPAPCEGSCVLGIIDSPVTIKNIEMTIIDHAFSQGWIIPNPPSARTGKKVCIIGSGPAGLAAADQLNKAGHQVTVYERSDRIGGLLMYGVPNMKLDKELVVQRRVDLMIQEGVEFVTNTEVGIDVDTLELKAKYDALLFATGSTIPRDLPIKNRDLKGIHFAMDFLTQNTKSFLDSKFVDEKFINAKGKRVIVIGGGDTGNDCIGTSMRHGARSVTNFELLPQPPEFRAADNPWPQWPKIFRIDYGHSEVKKIHGEDPRQYCILSKEFLNDGNGNVSGISTVRIKWEKDPSGRWQFTELSGTERVFQADLVFLAMGFIGPEKKASDPLNLACTKFGNFQAEYGDFHTNVEGVFAAGDCRRGQSLVVWGISEGRQAAREIDRYLMGSTLLP